MSLIVFHFPYSLLSFIHIAVSPSFSASSDLCHPSFLHLSFNPSRPQLSPSLPKGRPRKLLARADKGKEIMPESDNIPPLTPMPICRPDK